ncbi:hypothetical protein HDU93_009576 [Gonapodya sp. JEL0774]|nr:hypothetical protein HDU93_009576 [Gonapodya sp. JEL0774]
MSETSQAALVDPLDITHASLEEPTNLQFQREGYLDATDGTLIRPASTLISPTTIISEPEKATISKRSPRPVSSSTLLTRFSQVTSIARTDRTERTLTETRSVAIDPPTFTAWQRRAVVLLAALGGFIGTFSQAMYTPLLATIQSSLQCTDLQINATLTIYVLMEGFAPLFLWGPMGDTYGRRPVYLIGLGIYIISCGFSFFATNFWMLLVGMMLAGFGISAAIANGVAAISDVFPKERRGRVLAMFYLGALLGPFLDALRSMVKLRFPFVTLVVIWMAILFSANAAVITQASRQYTAVYRFTDRQLGLIPLAPGIGTLIGGIFSGWHSDRLARRSTFQMGFYVSEDRLRSTWVGAVAVPIGLIMFGVGFQRQLPPLVPLLGQCLLAFGTLWIVTSENAYLVELWPHETASVISIALFWRFLIAAMTPLFITTSVDREGPAKVFFLYAVFHVLAAAGVVWVAIAGGKYRMSRSPWKEQPQNGNTEGSVELGGMVAA